MMAEPVRFVKIRVCKNCGEWLQPGYKEELCQKCMRGEEQDEIHDLPKIDESNLP